MLHARLNTSPTPGRVLRRTSVLRRWYQLLWRVWEHYVTDRCQEWRDVIGLTQQKLRWFQNILVGKVESERPHIHVWVHECARLGDFTKFSIGLLACLSIGLVQIWILGGLEGVTTRGVVDLMKFVDRDLQLHEPLCLPIQTKFFCFADESQKKPYIKIFYTKTFRIERVNQDIVHFTTYCIKKTKWHTQFRDLIHTFICLERRRIMKKEKLDVISWRRNISFMCKCGGEKKRTFIMRRFFLEGDEKKDKEGGI